MEVVTGILGAIALYAVLWFLFTQHESAKEKARQQGIEDGKSLGFREALEINDLYRSSIRANTPIPIHIELEDMEDDGYKPDWLIPMPAELYKTLEGLSLREAVDQDLLTDIGRDNEYIFRHYTMEGDEVYFLVNDFALRISEKLAQKLMTMEEIFANSDYLYFTIHETVCAGKYERLELCYSHPSSEQDFI